MPKASEVLTEITPFSIRNSVKTVLSSAVDETYNLDSATGQFKNSSGTNLPTNWVNLINSFGNDLADSNAHCTIEEELLDGSKWVPVFRTSTRDTGSLDDTRWHIYAVAEDGTTPYSSQLDFNARNISHDNARWYKHFEEANIKVMFCLAEHEDESIRIHWLKHDTSTGVDVFTRQFNALSLSNRKLISDIKYDSSGNTYFVSLDSNDVIYFNVVNMLSDGVITHTESVLTLTNATGINFASYVARNNGMQNYSNLLLNGYHSVTATDGSFGNSISFKLIKPDIKDKYEANTIFYKFNVELTNGDPSTGTLTVTESSKIKSFQKAQEEENVYWRNGTEKMFNFSGQSDKPMLYDTSYWKSWDLTTNTAKEIVTAAMIEAYNANRKYVYFEYLVDLSTEKRTLVDIFTSHNNFGTTYPGIAWVENQDTNTKIKMLSTGRTAMYVYSSVANNLSRYNGDEDFIFDISSMSTITNEKLYLWLNYYLSGSSVYEYMFLVKPMNILFGDTLVLDSQTIELYPRQGETIRSANAFNTSFTGVMNSLYAKDDQGNLTALTLYLSQPERDHEPWILLRGKALEGTVEKYLEDQQYENNIYIMHYSYRRSLAIGWSNPLFFYVQHFTFDARLNSGTTNSSWITGWLETSYQHIDGNLRYAYATGENANQILFDGNTMRKASEREYIFREFPIMYRYNTSYYSSTRISNYHLLMYDPPIFGILPRDKEIQIFDRTEFNATYNDELQITVTEPDGSQTLYEYVVIDYNGDNALCFLKDKTQLG